MDFHDISVVWKMLETSGQGIVYYPAMQVCSLYFPLLNLRGMVYNPCPAVSIQSETRFIPDQKTVKFEKHILY